MATNGISDDSNGGTNDNDDDLKPAESGRSPKMLKAFNSDADTEVPDKQNGDNSTEAGMSALPWIGPLRLPWNLSSLASLTSQVNQLPASPVKIVLGSIL
jgi:hypothetical protein